MPVLQPVRGTHDLLPDEMRRHRQVLDCARDVAELYGYDFMATPIFEFTDVFKRTLGDASDVVTKEMYTFETKSGEEITLRPENTASVMRAMLSGGLAQSLPLKYFYGGPMFRHERPQKGRYRQFHQFGVELIGVPQPLGDIEIIALGARILDALGLVGEIELELNTLGDVESRRAYRDALVAYFSEHIDALSEESRDRLTRNPLRILDSKNKGDQALVADAPAFDAYLNQASQDFFGAVCEGLGELGIAYRLNPYLVRGLDYYGHTAFEFKSAGLGAQGTVMAGGRYDGLCELMGGAPTAGVGWAAGVERLAMLLGDTPTARRPLSVVPLGAAAEKAALGLTEDLRAAGHRVELGFSGNMKKRLQRANKAAARAALLLGDDELSAGEVTLRDLDSGDQRRIARADLVRELQPFL